MKRQDPAVGEVFTARRNLEVRVVAVWPQRIDLELLIAGERSKPIAMRRAVFEEIFYGPTRLMATQAGD